MLKSNSNKPSPPEVTFWSWCFIAATEALPKTDHLPNCMEYSRDNELIVNGDSHVARFVKC